MNKYLKKVFIVAVAVCCALSVQLSVSALPSIDDLSPEALSSWLNNLFTTTTQPVETTVDPNETTTSGNNDETTTDIVNSTGNGTVTTTETTTAYDTTVYNPVTMPPTVVATTTEPVNEETSLSFEASLSDLFEADSANVIVQPSPTEPFTIGGLVVNNNNGGEDSFSWQKIALIAAAVLFVVLLALVVALLVQRSKNTDDNYASSDSDGEPSGPVAVEVMTPERIAELLGSTGRAQSMGGFGEMSSAESAAAIKTAALMGQLTHSYSDPLIRKYTDEPVMISPSAASVLDSENASAADILRATDSMLNDITGDEKYASDLSGYNFTFDSDDDSQPVQAPARICPDCGNSVPADDVFCHQCGTYIG